MNVSAAGSLLAVLLLVGGCDDMTQQKKENPYASSETAPATVPDSVVEFQESDHPPPALTLALLQRGQSEFHAFCSPCHAETGNGHGMVVQRGFPAPEPLTDPDLMTASPRHLYDVLTDGKGIMYGFAQRISPEDRWAIVAYMRALQLSQHATLASLTPEQQAMP